MTEDGMVGWHHQLNGYEFGYTVEPFPSPGHFPNPEIEPGSPTLQADSLPSEPLGKPMKHPFLLLNIQRAIPLFSSTEQ